MSEQHKSKSAKAESPLTPKAVHRAYVLARRLFTEIRDGYGIVQATLPASPASTPQIRAGYLRFRILCDTLKGLLTELDSAITPELALEAVAEQSPTGAVSVYVLAGCSENSALMALYKGGWRILDEGPSFYSFPTNREELDTLRLALNAEAKRVLEKAEAATAVGGKVSLAGTGNSETGAISVHGNGNQVTVQSNSPGATAKMASPIVLAAGRDINQQEPAQRKQTGGLAQFFKRWKWLGAIAEVTARIVAAATEIKRFIWGQ